MNHLPIWSFLLFLEYTLRVLLSYDDLKYLVVYKYEDYIDVYAN